MKTLTVLNNCDFIFTVAKDTEYLNSPGFLCYIKETQSIVCSSSTEAINACYKKVFCSNAKFSDLPVMGFDNSNIVQQLLSDVVFHSYMFSLGKLNIFVLRMGKSKKPEWNYAGEGYKSVFQYNFDNVKSIFIQEIEYKECVIQVFTNETLKKTYNTIDPDEA
ncbi:11076_t:CDS:1 [Funneliformis geosporum]|uniref:11076_t:CDS:1 n=1 Tax=Funneliformis geosporum TaxID=1117311 RepID=A0A9W4T6U1_9GLOM|nr:11076_t:CDS:1 [Funneliformis geosporum]